jgi:hypothetical protein
MSTATETARFITIGMRFRAPYLVQQAGYTLGIAAAEGEPLAALCPAGHLVKTTQLRDDVDKATQDKTVRAAEAKQTTVTQNEHMRAATVWIRKVGKRCQSALQLGITLPPELTRTSSPTTVPGMLEQMNKTLALLGQHSAAMDSLGPATAPLIEQGRTLMQTLQQADTAQEQARAFDLPASVATFYAKKGELYTALKIINNAGHANHHPGAAPVTSFHWGTGRRRFSTCACMRGLGKGDHCIGGDDHRL